MTNYSRSVLKSNGFRHSKNLPVKFGFSPKTVPANIGKKLPPQRCFKPLFIAFFNFSHKRPTFAFAGESGYTLAFRRKIAHKRLHAETGGVSDGVLLLPSDCFTRFGKPAWPGGRTANCAAFGSWPGALSKNAEGLLGCVIFSLLPKLRLVHPALSAFRMCETRGGITTLGALCVLLKHSAPACQSDSFVIF